jgi:hypothetical protein
MKTIAISVAGLGVLALLVALLEKLAGFQLLGMLPSTWLKGASTLYLLALVVMIYDRCYGGPPAAPKA